MEGAFSTRGETITVVNLARALGMKEQMDEPTQDMFLITNFNMVSTGFHVHGVVGIHRVNWGQIIQPDSMICNSSKSMITGIVNLDGKLVLILVLRQSLQRSPRISETIMEPVIWKTERPIMLRSFLQRIPGCSAC